MNALADQQAAFVAALFAPRQAEAEQITRDLVVGTPDWQRGLAAYRANGLALAARALAAAHPVTAQLLGDESFEAVAHRLWLEHPPARGDIAQWGAGLAPLLAGLPGLRDDDPYVADVARLEWALHAGSTQPDRAAQPATFGLLAQHPPEQLSFVLAPGTDCVRSPWPVVSIWRAHRADADLMAVARDRLATRTGEDALVWRRGWVPCVREALAGEAAFITALKESGSLADGCSAAPGLDLGAWLETAVRDGLLLAIVARP